MDAATMRVSGRMDVNGDGRAQENKFAIRASAPICGDSGRISLTARPAYRPSLSIDKNGISSNVNARAITDLSSTDDVDIQVEKQAEILGQQTNILMDWQNAINRCTPRMELRTSHDKVGDINVTMAKRGNTHVLPDDQPLQHDMCRVGVKLPLNDLIGNKDVSVTQEFDLGNNTATTRLGYKMNDVTIGLKSDVNIDNNNMKHRLTVGYNAPEGVHAEVQVHDNMAGRLRLTKDKYEVRVPFSKDNGVNIKDVQLRTTWSLDL